MKKVTFIALIAFTIVVLSCKKEECHECHYELNGGEVNLGEKCGDEMENLEANGYTVNGVKYDVHCAEH